MQVAIINSQPTMSSRDIAELVESRHADVWAEAYAVEIIATEAA